jgi:hypothetical protein
MSDDLDGKGSSTGTKPGTGDKDPSATVQSTVKAMAEEFRKTLEAARAQATPPVPVSTPSGPDPKAIMTKALDDYQTRSESGDYKGAVAQLIDAIGKAQEGTAPKSVDDHPAYRALEAQARRTFKQDHPDVASKWLGEVEAKMRSLPIEQRLSPDAWSQAAREVKVSHLDDVLAEERQKMEEEFRKSLGAGLPGGNPPFSDGRGVPGARGPAGLSPDDQRTADILGFDADTFAKARKDYEAAVIRDGDTRTVALVDTPRRVEPGRF